jgi:nitrite reductase/ring-hydroxylating ferredoxin subunit
MTMQRALRAEDLWTGEMTSLRLDGGTVLLARLDDRVVAYADRCVHKGVPLSTGTLERCVLTCSGHLWRFDLRDGRGVNPATARLRPLAVEIRDGEIWVDPDPAARSPEDDDADGASQPRDRACRADADAAAAVPACAAERRR